MALPPIGQDRLVGQTLGHYRIVEKVGAGGMGEVYRAQDEHLEREVAIKVLPPGTLADERTRKRFHKEALTLSKLNHPNIATIHDFDTQQGVDFLVMEYIPGITVSEKLAARPLLEKEVVALGTQLAEGLSAAHEHGVVHCDLKPGNLRLTGDGRLKILDFGLAKLRLPVTASAATQSLSEKQAMAGTVPYMAPEQLLGGEIDARTDIHAAGSVLYEAATGKRPFADVEGSQLIGAILRKPPLPPTVLNPRLPPELERIIGKCLEKEPENRYQSAKELAIDLRRLQTGVLSAAQPATRPAKWSSAKSVGLGLVVVAAVIVLLFFLDIGRWRQRLLGGTGGRRIESLAVLPLANLSGDPQQEYFADGMTEELITELSKIKALKVISRTSAMQYKGVKKPLPQIGRELDVDAVVEGSVLRVGDHVRISAQLLRADTDTHLWANSYERDLRDILALQGQVARDIANEIRVELRPAEQLKLTTTRKVDPVAQAAYLKGRYFINRFAEEDFVKCTQYIEEATKRDPAYAEAYGALATCYQLQAWSQPPKEIFPKVKTAALKALEIDKNLSEGHQALGFAMLFFDWDWAGAEKELKQAIDEDPSSALAHYSYSLRLLFAGQIDEGIAEARKALELDPASIIMNRQLVWTYLYARRYDDAIAQGNAALELDPANLEVRLRISQAYALKRSGVLAGPYVGRAEDANLRGALGQGRAEVLDFLEDLKAKAKKQYVDPVMIASNYAQLGDKEQALKWLGKGYETRSGDMVHLKISPFLDPLRSDPRFQDLMHRINFPQ